MSTKIRPDNRRVAAQQIGNDFDAITATTSDDATKSIDQSSKFQNDAKKSNVKPNVKLITANTLEKELSKLVIQF